jgi:hypothetical protein
MDTEKTCCRTCACPPFHLFCTPVGGVPALLGKQVESWRAVTHYPPSVDSVLSQLRWEREVDQVERLYLSFVPLIHLVLYQPLVGKKVERWKGVNHRWNS